MRPRSLLVFDVPGSRELLLRLEEAFPGEAFRLESAWRLPTDTVDGAIPVWVWTRPAQELAQEAGDLIGSFVFPLVLSKLPFVIGFGFGRAAFDPKELDLEGLSQLDLEDLGRLLSDNALDASTETVSCAADRVALTPIERRLAAAFRDIGIEAEPQVALGPYRADFLVESGGVRIVVEADGRVFHDPDADAVRDKALQALGIDRVIRFTGSEIYRDPGECAATVRQCLDRSAPIRRWKPDEQLDPSQQRAARHRAGAARVLAPAGSGKTKTMVAHVLELLNQGVSPGSILVLAFNRKAADQLWQRLGHLQVPLTKDLKPYSDGVFCATFHSFGYRYQRQVVGLMPRIEPEGAPWRELMEHSLADCGVSLRGLKAVRGSDPLGQFLRKLDRVKANLEAPRGLDVEIESFATTEGKVTIHFEPIWHAFLKRQLAAGIQSFDDQLYITIRDLLQSPQRRRELQCRFQHILVDEFQDLSPAQLTLIDILSRPHRNLYVVGDDDQLIYGWRFADPSNILGFHDRVPPEPYSATYTLSTNYRCSRAVVETSRRLIDRNRRREPKDFVARTDAPPGSVRFYPSANWAERAAEIATFLKRERERHDCKWRQLAVLCRYKAQQAPLAMALDAAGIPRSPLLRYRLFTHQAAILLRAYVDLVLQPSAASGEALRLVLNRPNRYLKNADVERIASALDPWSALKEWEDGGALAPKAVPAFLRAVESLHSKTSELAAADLLSEVVAEFGLERFWRDQLKRGAEGEQDDAGPMQVIGVLRMLAADVRDIRGFLTQWNDLREREEQSEDIEDDSLAREEPDIDDHVVIGTIHSSKGREYRSVVLVDYEPDLSRMNDAELEEERRVLYVGITRAEQSLLVTVDERRPVCTLLLEMILPRIDPDEEKRAAESLKACRASIHTRSAEIARVLQEIEALEAGREEARLVQELEGRRSEVRTLDAQVQQVCLEYESSSRPGAAPIDSVSAQALQDDLRRASQRFEALRASIDALRREQAAARANGGWWPSSEREQERWEFELNQQRQRASRLQDDIDGIRMEIAQGGIGGAWKRISGRQGQLERRHLELTQEMQQLQERSKAMLQIRNITEELERQNREAGAERSATSALERQVDLVASFHRLAGERRRLESELRAVEDRLNVIRTRPEVARAALAQKLREAQQRAYEAETEQSRLESRMVELSLLGS